jgi:superfamily II DNA or RNA helicase
VSDNEPPYIRFQGDDLAYYGKLYPFLKGKITTSWEEKGNFYRIYPREYITIMEEVSKFNLPIKSSLPFSLPEFLLSSEYSNLKLSLSLFQFQEQALNSWIRNRYRGIVVLPTGSGKTILGCAAIQKLGISTIIIVPTILLLEQWRNRLIEYLNLNSDQIGLFGGGNQDIKPITISTFESAHLYLSRFRSQFGLMIIDEAHNLSGINYEKILDGYLSPYRIALTATLNSKDSAFKTLTEKGLQKIVYEAFPKDLENIEILAPYKIISIKIDKIKEESEYSKNIDILKSFFNKYNIYGSDAFEKLRFMVNRNTDAYNALQAYNIAKRIAFSAEDKLTELEKLLIQHSDEKMIIFSDLIDFCERIGREFLIPVLTHRTSKEERNRIMKMFREKSDTKLCVGKIFDEGMDVPSAKIGVIISGSSQNRQFIQRLGRLLRKDKEEKIAILYEIVSKNTLESRYSSKRKAGI